MPVTSRAWTSLELRLLEELRLEGLSLSHIAFALSRSVGSINRRRIRSKLPPFTRPWGDEEKMRLEEMRLEGQTAAQIALALGRSIHAVKQQARVLRCPKFYRRRAEYLERFRRGESNNQIAADLGVSVESVKAARWRMRQQGIEV